MSARHQTQLLGHDAPGTSAVKGMIKIEFRMPQRGIMILSGTLAPGASAIPAPKLNAKPKPQKYTASHFGCRYEPEWKPHRPNFRNCRRCQALSRAGEGQPDASSRIIGFNDPRKKANSFPARSQGF